jgi:hypothetical protein
MKAPANCPYPGRHAEALTRHNTTLRISDTDIRNINPKRSGKGYLMILFLKKNVADMFVGSEFA